MNKSYSRWLSIPFANNQAFVKIRSLTLLSFFLSILILNNGPTTISL